MLLAVSLFIGTLLGTLFFAIAGLGKLLPGHPMHSVLSSTFDKAIGPFFGLPATFLRLVIGFAELSAGLCFIVVPWGLYFDTFGPNLKAPVEALLLCAIIGMQAIMIVALVFNCLVEGQLKKIAPYIVFVALLATFYYIQVDTTDFEEMPENWILFIYNFFAFCAVGTVITWLWYCKFGSTIEELKERMVEIERMREELLK